MPVIVAQIRSAPVWRLRLPLYIALAVLAGAAPAACGAEETGGFGPLAVIEDRDGRHEALGGTGPVSIGDDCVTMTTFGGLTHLLVWRAGDVRWDGASREITFRGTLTIRDGDVITVGGSGWLPDEGPGKVSWLATPHPSCAGDPWDAASVSTSPPPGLLEDEP